MRKARKIFRKVLDFRGELWYVVVKSYSVEFQGATLRSKGELRL